MGFIAWLGGRGSLLEATRDPSLDVITERLHGAELDRALAEESLVDAQLALEDQGWTALTSQADVEFGIAGLHRAAKVCRAMTVTNVLVQRGVAVRIGYIWGSGVTVTAKDDDVQEVVQAFLDDEGNRAAFTGEQAHEENERALATDGNVFVALFTKPATGRVQARTIGFDEIADVVCNPDDKDDPWFYLRQWTTTVIGQDGATRTEQRKAYYPALGHRPRTRIRSIDGVEVQWDSPVLHISVNRLDGWRFGIGDTYTAIGWARLYREFLADWAQLVKALSRYAWRHTSKGRSAAEKAAARVRQVVPQGLGETASNAGATAAMTADQTLEAVPKTGATIDSESGRPIASMVAAGLGIPVTTLLGDPGQTGARAVAETLNQPTRLEMNMRRDRWAEAYRRVTGYVVAEAVRAPRGPLQGTVIRDEHDREVVTLAQDASTSVEVSFPPLDEANVKDVIDGIVAADGTGKIPDEIIARLLLEALDVEDIDAVLEGMRDADGNFQVPEITAGLQAMRRFDQGQS